MSRYRPCPDMSNTVKERLFFSNPSIANPTVGLTSCADALRRSERGRERGREGKVYVHKYTGTCNAYVYVAVQYQWCMN